MEMSQFKQKSKFREYAESLGIAILIALLLRSFVFEAFKIPSGSMLPTLSLGDHIFVNKFAYGLRLPLTKFKLVNFAKPKRGDVIVFIYPADESKEFLKWVFESKDFIKRVVGIPGDRIKIENNEIFVN